MFLVGELSNTVTVIITIGALVMSVVLIILLSVHVKKERIKYNNEHKQFIEGLKTKSELEAEINYFLSKHGRSGSFTLMYIDIDQFVEINNAFGKERGDQILAKAAYNIQDALPITCKMTRYDSDEFLVFIKHETNHDKITTLAEKVVDAISRPIVVYEDTIANLSGCIGIAFYPNHGSNIKRLMANLDMALYIAKRNGKGHYAIYSDDMAKNETENVTYYHQIKEAIKNKQFCLYYQPIVDIEKQQIIAMEALIRWNHPTQGVLSPLKFLNIMEQSGDINWVGIWGFEELVKEHFILKRQFPYNKFLLTMNLSPKQLMNENLINDILRITHRYHVESSNFCFEIVEFAMFEKQKTVSLNINQLRTLGFKIAIDGYGLEYATLSHLNNLPVDLIKLDKGFAEATKDNYMAEKISEMLVGFAKINDKVIIAEGIENVEMLEHARKLTIRYAQGYYYSAPLSNEDIEKYITSFQNPETGDQKSTNNSIK